MKSVRYRRRVVVASLKLNGRKEIFRKCLCKDGRMKMDDVTYKASVDDDQD